MIRVANLVYEYPGTRALDDVEFSIDAGSITALVGPNGAGKTTLMRCICGLAMPLNGTITVDTIDVIEEPRLSHERIGYLSDFFGLYDDLTVSQCLRYSAWANGVADDAATIARDTAARLGLQDRLGQPVGVLSRGLRQRVAIGQSIVHSPKVLILDEPASGLDPEARHDLAQLFKALQRDGMTIMVSSHILAELEEYATHMLVIRSGRIVEQKRLREFRPRRQLVLDTLEVASDVAGIVGELPGVAHVTEIEGSLAFDFDGDLAAQHRLLRELIDAGISVVRFTTLEKDLQQSYLDTVGEDR